MIGAAANTTTRLVRSLHFDNIHQLILNTPHAKSALTTTALMMLLLLSMAMMARFLAPGRVLRMLRSSHLVRLLSLSLLHVSAHAIQHWIQQWVLVHVVAPKPEHIQTAQLSKWIVQRR